MSSLLSRFSGGQTNASAQPQVTGHPLDPRRSASLLAGLEAADLGWFWESDGEGRLTYLT